LTGAPRDQDERPLGEVHLNGVELRFRSRLHIWLRDPLDGCTPGAVREACVVVGELLANAYRHATPPYRVRLTTTRRGHLIRLAVTDGAPGRADRWRLGRGLHVVRGLCPQWGVVPDLVNGVHGKTVWAELPVMVPPSAARSRTT
jgi:hypothetical protein